MPNRPKQRMRCISTTAGRSLTRGQHFWDPARADYPWMEAPGLARIRSCSAVRKERLENKLCKLVYNSGSEALWAPPLRIPNALIAFVFVGERGGTRTLDPMIKSFL